MVPKIITSINHEIVSGQKKKIVASTNSKVRLVYILLFMVSFTDRFIISSRSFQCFPPFPQNSFRFDLILSNITIVSFIEYPNIVRRAVMKKVSILNSGKYMDVNI